MSLSEKTKSDFQKFHDLDIRVRDAIINWDKRRKKAKE
jgi:hypothetical protein